MYIFLTLYTKHLNIKSSQNLQKERKKKPHRLQVHTILHYRFYTGHAYNVSIQRCIILILHSIFKLKGKRIKRGWMRGYGEERAERTTAASSWFWGLKYTGWRKEISKLKGNKASRRARTQSDRKVTIAFQKEPVMNLHWTHLHDQTRKCNIGLDKITQAHTQG